MDVVPERSPLAKMTSIVQSLNRTLEDVKGKLKKLEADLQREREDNVITKD